jgi:hypothetical protein
VRLAVLVLAVAGCGGSTSTPDAAGTEPDAAAEPDATGCVPADPPTECTNCLDDDRDGTADADDPECTGVYDLDESSYELGIPDWCESVDGFDDCPFDDNTGSGDDGCRHHACCSLVECPASLADNFDPGACDPSPQCVSSCAPLVDAECDCFGCCTVCDGATCRDILAVTCISPDCEYETFDDPQVCLACIKVESCPAP